MWSFVRRHALALAVLAIGLAAAGYAWAQGWPGYLLSSPLGTEQIEVTGILGNGTQSPVKNAVLLNTVRNTTGYQISAATSGTITTTPATDNLLLTGAVGTATVDVPPSPPDGQLFAICNANGSPFSGTITVASTDSSTFVPASPSLASLAASTCAEFQYTALSKVWYRVR